jgi:hypothetical protein
MVSWLGQFCTRHHHGDTIEAPALRRARQSERGVSQGGGKRRRRGEHMGRVGFDPRINFSLSLSLFLSLSRTHTHTRSLSLSLSLSFWGGEGNGGEERVFWNNVSHNDLQRCYSGLPSFHFPDRVKETYYRG